MINFIITTLVLGYDRYQSDIYHSFLQDKAKAIEQILGYINDDYADPDNPDTYFDSLDQVKGYFDNVYFSRQRIYVEFTNSGTALL